MHLEHWLVIIGNTISIIGISFYIRDTVRGKTKPNRVTWGLFALAPLVGFFAGLASGADIWATSRIFLAGFLPLIVFLVSFVNKQSYWKLTRFDIACGFFSLCALILWSVSGSPLYAVLLTITGDALAGLPTIRKSWSFPESETGITYIFSRTA